MSSVDISSQVSTMEQLEFHVTTIQIINDEMMVEGDIAATEDAFAKLVLALYCMICVVGITGNLLVAIVLLRVPSLRSNTSDFLVHLAIADSLVSLLVIPYFMVQRSTSASPGIFGEFWCRFYTSQFVFWCLATVSVMSLIAVNLERYVAIVSPHKYKTVFTKQNKYIMILAIWILAVVTESAVIIFNGIDDNECIFIGWPSRVAQLGFGLYGFALKFLGPLTVMVYAQAKVISTLNRQVKTLTSRSAAIANPRDQREMWQLRASQTFVKTLLACVITFAVCWAPNQIWFLLFNFDVPLTPGGHFHHITIILAVGNSCVNPVIYTMTNKPFRKGIREVFCKQRDSNQVGDSGAATGTASTETI